MNKRKGIRMIASLLLSIVLICGASVTAFAYSEDHGQDLPVTETQPEDNTGGESTVVPSENGEPFEEEGNAYTRDLLYDKTTNKQFITVTTRSGNTFYIIIDYDAPINEEEEQYQTYFLNMVDESDLLALLDEDAAAQLTTCMCDEKCGVGKINTECPVCRTNMSECTGKVPEPEAPDEGGEDEPPEKETGKSSGGNMVMIIVLVAAVGLGGAAYYYIKFVKGKKKKDEDLDFYDDEGYEESYVNEDEPGEPDIAENNEESEEDSSNDYEE